MLKHRWTDRICCLVLALTLILTCLYVGGALIGGRAVTDPGDYRSRLFDTSKVHTIDLVMDDWAGFLKNCTDEEYVSCAAVIDGEKFANVAIRAKGNTSLSNVESYGNDRYSFKLEFDHFVKGKTYYGLDKLCLNNLIQDNTGMKDYLAYTLMNKMGVAAPLCSYVWITVNGEDWGLYLAVEAVEDAFLARNYGGQTGELYKPDSMSFGGGRGNGMGFDMDDFREKFQKESSTDATSSATAKDTDDAASSATPKNPGDTTSSGFPGMPGGMTPPDGTSMPEGMTPPDGTSMPSGMTPPDGTSMPEGMTPPAGTSMPEGMTPPDGFDPAKGGFDHGRSNGKGGMNGGPGGMSSADVQLQYIDDDPESYTNIFNNAKTDITDADKARLIASLKALSEGDTSVVDTDAVLRYMAVHNFMCNDDSYTGIMVHNYYLRENDGVLSMIPWDYNLSFGAMGGGMGTGGGSDATSVVNTAIDTLVSQGDGSSRPMAAWIMNDEASLARYHEIYTEFMNKANEEGWLTTELQRVIDLISPYWEKDPTAFCTYEEFRKATEAMKTFCALRAESVRGQLAGTIPSTSEGQRKDDSALVDASSVTLSDMNNFDGAGQGGPGRSGFPGGQGGPGGSNFPGGGNMPDFGNGNMQPPDGFGPSSGGQSTDSQAGTPQQPQEGFEPSSGAPATP